MPEIRLPPASHTFHANWKQCPRKSWHSNIARDVARQTSTALDWGNRVHEALERHLTAGDPLPVELKHYAPLYTFPVGYKIYAEVKLGMRRDRSPCEFFADDCFARGVLDVIVLVDERPNMAMLIDHKTGKVREDSKELELHALLLKVNYPRLDTIKGWYNWLSANKMGAVYDLSDTEVVYQRLLQTHEQIERAFALGADAFPPRQGPLCGWCPCTHCEYHP